MLKKVKCIDTSLSDGKLVKGKIYNVDHEGIKHYYFSKGNSAGWYKHRFQVIEDKKPTGYKLIKDLPLLTKGAILKWDSNSETWSIDFEYKGTEYYESFEDEHIKTLTEWFEPVYKPTEKSLKIKAGTVTVSSDGEILLTKGKTVYPTTHKQLEVLRIKLANTTLPNIEDFSARVESIHIGCTDGPTVSIKELDSVLAAYKSLQSK